LKSKRMFSRPSDTPPSSDTNYHSVAPSSICGGVP
jgi:hypothetical protein